MKQNFKFFYESVFAGIAIALGGLAKIITATMAYPWMAALAFAIGIIMVMAMKFKLYTGFTPTFANYEKPIPKFFICLFGNFVGATAVGLSIKVFNYNLFVHACDMIVASMNMPFLAVFISAIVCGIIIACIVRIKNEPIKYLMSLPLIALFILLGCHHVVADFFYMAVTRSYNISTLIAALLGNTVGGLIFGCYDLIKGE